MRPRLHLAFAACLLFILGADRCPGGEPITRLRLLPQPGAPLFQRPALFPVPGGLLNLAGGNLLLRRVDLSLDTRLGTREIGATWNSSSRSWRWSFELTYDGTTLVDASGAEYDARVEDGQRLAGSVWVRLDGTRVRSLGGLVHEFDPGGGLGAIHWHSGAYPRLEWTREIFAGQSRVTGAQQCRAPGSCQLLYQVAYDGAGRVAEIVDRAGRSTRYAYDEGGRLTQARDPHDLERGAPGFRYEYAALGQIVAFTTSEEERVEFDVAPKLGSVYEVRRRGAEDRVHRFTYGSLTNLPTAPHVPARWTRVEDPTGHVGEYVFDREYRLHERALAEDEVTRWEWSGFEISQRTEPDGRTTRWEREDEDELVRVEPDGRRVTIDFHVVGAENRERPFERPVDRVYDDLGTIERYGYRYGRLRWRENGAGERVRFEYDAENMVQRVVAPDGVTFDLEDYGEHGHPERVTVGGEVATHHYDAVGNLLSTEGANRFDLRPPGELAREYDGDRNVAALHLEASPGGPSAVRLEWRSDRQLRRVERPLTGDHELDYDAFGGLAAVRERVDGAWRVTAHERDALGRVTAVELPNGMRRELDHDALGRVVAVRGLRHGELESEARLHYEQGRLARVEDAAHTGPERYVYDAAGRVSQVVFPDGESLERAYDTRGRLAGESYRRPDGSLLLALDLAHDDADRATRLADADGTLLEQSFAEGRLAEMRTGGGLVRRFSYDPGTGELEAWTAERERPWGGPVPVAAGQVTRSLGTNAVEHASATDLLEAPAGTSDERHALGPLGSGGKRAVEWSDGSETRELLHDALGNLTRQGWQRLEYNPEHNRLLHVETMTTGARVEYQWDDAGYAVARGGLELAWTALGAIARAGDRHFSWDGLGRPLGRIEEGTERRMLYGGRVEADAAGTPLRLEIAEVALDLVGGWHRYRHRDFRGNVALESDEAGEIVAHHRYSTYGPEAASGDPGTAGFAGGRPVGDLVLLGGRLHDPLAGRFLAPDPILQLGSQHAYASGNPVWWWDASGLQAELSPAQQALVVEGLYRVAFGTLTAGAGVLIVLHPAGVLAYPLGIALIGGGALEIQRGLVAIFATIQSAHDAPLLAPGSAPAMTPSSPLPPPAPGPGPGPGEPSCPCGDALPGGGQATPDVVPGIPAIGSFHGFGL